MPSGPARPVRLGGGWYALDGERVVARRLGITEPGGHVLTVAHLAAMSQDDLDARAGDVRVFARGLWQHAIWVGLLMAGLSFGTQAFAIRVGDSHWQRMTFTVSTLSQLGHVLAIRGGVSDRVIQRADRLVLVVPPPEADAE